MCVFALHLVRYCPLVSSRSFFHLLACRNAPPGVEGADSRLSALDSRSLRAEAEAGARGEAAAAEAAEEEEAVATLVGSPDGAAAALELAAAVMGRVEWAGGRAGVGRSITLLLVLLSRYALVGRSSVCCGHCCGSACASGARKVAVGEAAEEGECEEAVPPWPLPLLVAVAAVAPLPRVDDVARERGGRVAEVMVMRVLGSCPPLKLVRGLLMAPLRAAAAAIAAAIDCFCARSISATRNSLSCILRALRRMVACMRMLFCTSGYCDSTPSKSSFERTRISQNVTARTDAVLKSKRTETNKQEMSDWMQHSDSEFALCVCVCRSVRVSDLFCSNMTATSPT